MPTCVVPHCNNSTVNSSYSFYRFPKEENQRRQWVERIRRKDYTYKVHDRICSWHFPRGKEEGPIRFKWSEKTQFSLQFQEGLGKRTKTKLHQKQNPLPETITTPLPATSVGSSKRKQVFHSRLGIDSPQNFISSSSSSLLVLSELEKCKEELKITRNKFQEAKNEMENLKTLNTQLAEENKDLKQRLEASLHEASQLTSAIECATMKTDNLQKNNASLRNQLQTEYNFKSENFTLKKQIQSLQKLHTQKPKPICDHACQKFDIEKVKLWDSKLMSSFIGLQKYSSFEALLDILSQKSIIYLSEKGSKVKKVSFSQQLFITLMKFRLDVPQCVLGYIFGVSQKTISVIFNTFLEAIYQVFYEGTGPLSTIPSRFKNATSLPKSFSDMPNCRTVIDCTELLMETPAKLTQKKAVYSHYKTRYTMKILVGCAPNGTVNFVSNLYGGSESDKSMVIQSKLLNHMEPGDMILADKGFQLYDILPPGVTLNIPSFLVHNQFTVNEILKNIMYARSRVIIERLNAKFKIFRILQVIKATNREKADKLVKVCIALTTLMAELVNQDLSEENM